MNLQDLIKQEHFSSASQHVLLGILVTGGWITGRFTATLAPFNVTPAQYNVLRILRGSHPKALTCSEVGERLLERTPDVTRLLNRLERAGLIQRERSGHDRRVVEVRITEEGVSLLAEIRPHMDLELQELTKHLTTEEMNQISALLDRMRTEQV